MQTNCTVVINTFGRPAATVCAALGSVLDQDPQPLELILVDQNPLPLVLPPAINTHRLFRYQRIDSPCLSVARNSALVSARGRWIVFIDDDACLCPHYMRVLSTVIDTCHDLELIAGSVRCKDGDGYYSFRHRLGGDPSRFRHTKLVMGSNFAIRKSVLAALGGFDEAFGAGCRWGSSEETDLAWRACFSGVRSRYVRELVVLHPGSHDRGRKSNLLKSFRGGMGKGALVAKWLFTECRPVVLYELVEMTLVPVVKAAVSLLRLEPCQALARLAALLGRYTGLPAYMLHRAGQRIGKSFGRGRS